MKSVSIGQYIPFDTPIHRIDPRIKIILSLLFMIMIFFVKNMITYLPIFIFLAVIIKLAKIPVKSLINGMKPIFVLLIITAIINILTTPGQQLFTIYKLSVTKEGLYKSVFMIIRLVFIIVATSALTYTTSPIELTDGLEKLFSPLKKIGFPAGELAMMISIALRFIPTLFNESEKIRLAQMSRGADFESGNIINRAKNMIPLLVPLFINSFKRADELSTAMEARLYRTGRYRTRLNELKLRKNDWVILILTLIFYSIIIGIRYI
ncbi:MAG: energy-coupling factor transporter transmembrane component T [Tissierellia bacterium]|nr:energy-coupling factor transporter transmembrane component T [Tissierellia bacterium]